MKPLMAALAVTLAFAAPGTAGVGPSETATVEFVREGARGQDHRGDWQGRATVSQRAVMNSVLRDGFAQVDDIRLRSGRYVVKAVRPNGAVFRLSYDARSGRMVSRERLGWARSYDRRDYSRPRLHGVEFRLDLS